MLLLPWPCLMRLPPPSLLALRPQKTLPAIGNAAVTVKGGITDMEAVDMEAADMDVIVTTVVDSKFCSRFGFLTTCLTGQQRSPSLVDLPRNMEMSVHEIGGS
jgi:hypothetical protein